jgi:hypothetical protein
VVFHHHFETTKSFTNFRHDFHKQELAYFLSIFLLQTKKNTWAIFVRQNKSFILVKRASTKNQQLACCNLIVVDLLRWRKCDALQALLVCLRGRAAKQSGARLIRVPASAHEG